MVMKVLYRGDDEVVVEGKMVVVVVEEVVKGGEINGGRDRGRWCW